MKYVKISLLTICLLSNIAGQPLIAKEIEKHIPHAREEITLSYAKVVKKISPAVVNIFTVQNSKTAPPNSPFFEDPFFKQFFERLNPEYEPQQVSLGSGVIVNKEGYILTNYHVVQNADKIRVVLSDKEEFLAKLVKKDKRSDLALLKINSKKDFPYLEVSPYEDLEVGDVVLAIGNPFGVGQTVTHGIVSAIARGQEGINDFRSFIQTDAAINPGNSGGPLVTTDGRLVGINTAIYSKSGGSMGIGFAIPTTLAIPVIDSLKNGGRIVRPWMGVDVVPVTQELTQKLGFSHPYGVVVKDIYPGGPAHKAGLKKGDIIESIDGDEIEDKAALEYLVAISPIGKKATVKILRQGKSLNLPIRFIEPMEAKDPQPFIIEGRNPLQGAKMRVLSPALALEMGLSPMQMGVVITELTTNGAAAQLGVLPGDVLLSVNKKNVTTKKEVLNLLKESEDSWRIVLRRGNKLLNVVVKGTSNSPLSYTSKSLTN
jgi:Do/DeqQ family serine protease